MITGGKPETKKLNYKWVIVAVCGLMVFVCLGFCSSGRNIYTFAITEGLNIPRGAYSLSDTCRYAATAIVNIFFGSLMAKFGPKKLIASGFVFLIASSLICSVATTLPAFYLGGAFLGIGLSFTTTTMVGSVINKWCKKNKGTIMGFVLATNGVGAAVATQMVTPIIYNENNPLGYQNAFRLVAVILAVVGLIVFIFFKDKPPVEEKTDIKDISKKSNDWDGIKFSVALKKPLFYLTSASVFMTGVILQGFSGASSLHLQDMAIPHAFVAVVLSINSVALTFTKFLAGVIYDRFGLRSTITVTSVSGVASFVLILLVRNDSLGCFLAIVYALIAAVAQPLQTVMLPIYAGDLFGQRSYDKILGIFVSINMVGCALGSPIVNFAHDIIGNYTLTFILALATMVCIFIFMHISISAASRERAKEMERKATIC